MSHTFSHTKTKKALKIRALLCTLVPGTGVEPVQALLLTGF
jgi:hypothetical protein